MHAHEQQERVREGVLPTLAPLARLGAKGALVETFLCSLPDRCPAPGPLSAASSFQFLILSLACGEGDSQDCHVPLKQKILHAL